MGVESPLDPVPSLCLGTSDISVYELVGAYSTFVNRGTYIKPYFITRIEDKYGNVIQDFPIRSREVLSEETSLPHAIYAERRNCEEQKGTALGLSWDLRNENEIGAKTGTTQNASDGWFVGLTKDLVAGAWVGGDDQKHPLSDILPWTGSQNALPIWDNFMTKVYADSKLGVEKGPFPRPLRPLNIEIDCEALKCFKAKVIL